MTVSGPGLWFAVRALQEAASGAASYTAEPFITVDDAGRLTAAGIRFRVPDYDAVYTLTLHYPAGTCSTHVEVRVVGGYPAPDWEKNRPGTEPGEPWFPQPISGCIPWVERMQTSGTLEGVRDFGAVRFDDRP